MIKVEHLEKRFGDFVAVNDVSFEVPAGEIFAFLGPNGAGKTTTIKMLTTLLKPSGGRITLDGLDPAETPNEAPPIRDCFSRPESRRSIIDGKIIPSLRYGEAEKKRGQEIYLQIKEGKLPMPAFKNQLTEDEIKRMVKFVRHDLQGKDD